MKRSFHDIDLAPEPDFPDAYYVNLYWRDEIGDVRRDTIAECLTLREANGLVQSVQRIAARDSTRLLL